MCVSGVWQQMNILGCGMLQVYFPEWMVFLMLFFFPEDHLLLKSHEIPVDNKFYSLVDGDGGVCTGGY